MTRHATIFLLLLPTAAGCGSEGERRPPSSGPQDQASRAAMSTIAGCDPAIMLLDANVPFQLVNEFATAKLFVAGCRASLSIRTRQQEKDLVSFLLREQLEREPQTLESTRFCGTTSSLPPAELLAEARKRLPGVSDWCWEMKSSSVS